MYTDKSMTKEDRKRATNSGLISGKEDKVASKDRRYNLSWVRGSYSESICKNKTYGYCAVVQKSKENLQQYKTGSFEKTRIV